MTSKHPTLVETSDAFLERREALKKERLQEVLRVTALPQTRMRRLGIAAMCAQCAETTRDYVRIEGVASNPASVYVPLCAVCFRDRQALAVP